MKANKLKAFILRRRGVIPSEEQTKSVIKYLKGIDMQDGYLVAQTVLTACNRLNIGKTEIH